MSDASLDEVVLTDAAAVPADVAPPDEPAAPGLDFRFEPGTRAYAWQLAESFAQLVAGRLAVRRLQELAGAALHAIERQEALARLPKNGALAVGCAPNVRAFLAAHAGARPGDVAAVRRVARVARELPALHAAWMRQECTEDEFRRLAAIVTPRTCELWLEAKRTLPPDEFDAKLRAAAPAQRPDEVTVEHHGRAAEREIQTAAGTGLLLDCTVAIGHAAAWVVHHATDLAGRKGHCTPTPGRAFKVWLERVDRALRAGAAPPAGWPKLEVHRCVRNEVSWFQTRWGNLEADARDLPGLESDWEVQVINRAGEILAQNVAALTEAFPFLTAPAPARNGDIRPTAPTPGEVRWSRPVTLRESLRRTLQAVGLKDPGALPIGEPRDDAEVAAEDAAAPWLPQPLGTVAERAMRAQAWLAANRPEFHGLTLADLQGVAAAAMRRITAWRYRDLELLRGCHGLFDGGHFPLVPFLETLGLSPRTYWDALRLYHRLEEALPKIRQAFIEGRLPYGKVRMLARRANGATEAGWLALALGVDEATLGAFVATTHQDDPAPRIPRDGSWPITPAGGRVRFRLELTLTPAEREQWQRVTAALESDGVPGTVEERLFVLARWYLQLESGQRRDRVIYHLSPSARAQIDDGDTAASPSWPAAVAERLAHCFPHLPWLADPNNQRHARALARADRLVRRRQAITQRHYEILSIVGQDTPSPDATVPACIRDAVRWRDGERCIVPGCGNTLVLQYDHCFPVSRFGAACLALDNRLCGPCNRARFAGLIALLLDETGLLHVVDRRRRRMGVRNPTLGQGWEEVLDAWAWDVARGDLPTAGVWAKFLRDAIAIQERGQLASRSAETVRAVLERGHSPPSALAPLAVARAG